MQRLAQEAAHEAPAAASTVSSLLAMIKMPNSFAGTYTESWADFLIEFDDFAQRMHLDAAERIVHMRPFLTGSALMAYDEVRVLAIPEGQDLWQIFRQEMQNRFPEDRYQALREVNFINRIQNPDETPEAYAHVLKELAKKAFRTFSAEERVRQVTSQFLRGLRPEKMRQQIVNTDTQNPTVDDFVRRAMQLYMWEPGTMLCNKSSNLELLMEAIAKLEKIPSPDVTERHESEQQPNEFCFYCHNLGLPCKNHTDSSCYRQNAPYQSIYPCQLCNAPDHWATDCPCYINQSIPYLSATDDDYQLSGSEYRECYNAEPEMCPSELVNHNEGLHPYDSQDYLPIFYVPENREHQSNKVSDSDSLKPVARENKVDQTEDERESNKMIMEMREQLDQLQKEKTQMQAEFEKMAYALNNERKAHIKTYDALTLLISYVDQMKCKSTELTDVTAENVRLRKENTKLRERLKKSECQTNASTGAMNLIRLNQPHKSAAPMRNELLKGQQKIKLATMGKHPVKKPAPNSANQRNGPQLANSTRKKFVNLIKHSDPIWAATRSNRKHDDVDCAWQGEGPCRLHQEMIRKERETPNTRRLWDPGKFKLIIPVSESKVHRERVDRGRSNLTPPECSDRECDT